MYASLCFISVDPGFTCAFEEDRNLPQCAFVRDADTQFMAWSDHAGPTLTETTGPNGDHTLGDAVGR